MGKFKVLGSKISSIKANVHINMNDKVSLDRRLTDTIIKWVQLIGKLHELKTEKNLKELTYRTAIKGQ